MRRRRLIKASLSTAVTALTAGAVGAHSKEVLSCIGDQATAAHIGRIYLGERPGDAWLRSPSVVSLVKAALKGDAIPARCLGQAVQQDFDLGNTVVIGGWVLSRTEARICAVLALS
jgi:hypothetical protein